MTKKWAGKICIYDGIVFYLGYSGDSDAHKHYAVKIVLSYEGQVSIFSKDNQEIRDTGLVVPANTLHRVQADGQQKVAFIFMEPYSKSGRALLAQYPGGNKIFKLMPDVSSACIRELGVIEQGVTSGNCDTKRIVSLLTGVNIKPQSIDERVQKTIYYIQNHLEEIESLESLAVILEISPRYLRKLFNQQVGMSLQRFRLWVKLRVALGHIAAGESFTMAAYAASFTDSAHFSRTFRSMFGIAPSEVMGTANKLNDKQLTI